MKKNSLIILLALLIINFSYSFGHNNNDSVPEEMLNNFASILSNGFIACSKKDDPNARSSAFAAAIYGICNIFKLISRDNDRSILFQDFELLKQRITELLDLENPEVVIIFKKHINTEE